MSEAKVLYIHPSKRSGKDSPDWVDFFSFYALFPMGVIGIVNLLRENGIPVKGLNYAMEIDSDPNFDLESWLKGEAGACLILIDLHWYEHSFGALEVAGICKKVFPVTSHWLCIGRGCKIDCSFCGGGSHAHKILANRDKIVLRSIDRVVEDISRLNQMGIDQVSLLPFSFPSTYPWKIIRPLRTIRGRGIYILLDP